MKPNTYVKLVNLGIPNPVEELPNLMDGDEIIVLKDDESVEVRNSVLSFGNIIIFRDEQRQVRRVIHTPHQVFIQELNKTIAAFRPARLFLTELDGNWIEDIAQEGNFAELLSPLEELGCSDELRRVAKEVLSTLQNIDVHTIPDIVEFDQFNIKCATNVGTEMFYGALNGFIQRTYGYILLPISAPNTRHAIDYFVLEANTTEEPGTVETVPA